MSNNYVVKDGNGSSLTIRSTDDGGGNQIPNVRLADATAANFMPPMDAAARAGYIFVTNGTQTLPTGDAAARKIFVAPTDGTNTATVKAASTAAVATDTGLVVSPHPSSPVTTNADAALTAGTAPSKALALAGQFLAFGSLPAATTGQTMGLQTDVAGTLKTGSVPLGSALTAGANVAATANNQTLSSAAGKMAYLSGFAITGLGATSAGSITVTTTGLANNLSFVVPIPAGVTVGITPLIVQFPVPIPASAVNTNIVVQVPSFGAGNTSASASAWGFLI
jgi:hypothetical protein